MLSLRPLARSCNTQNVLKPLLARLELAAVFDGVWSCQVAETPAVNVWGTTYLTSRGLAKQKAKKQQQQPPLHQQASPAMPAGQADLADTKSHMERAVDHLQQGLASLRTGRPSAGMLDHIKVQAYGEMMDLKNLATASVRGPQLLALTVFDPSTAEHVEKAIHQSPLNLNPKLEGQEILVPIPRPTKETMEAMMKQCRHQVEEAKVSIRQARKGAMDHIKAMASEDDRHRAEKEVQKLTDEYTASVDKLSADKERQLSTV